MKLAPRDAAPERVDELCALVGAADAAGEKISIAGGETLAGMGLPPERCDLALSTRRLSGVVTNEAGDLTIALRAGTTLRNVNELLAAQEQFVPFDAPRPQQATVGGTLAAGWLGPRRHRYGRLRDHLIGSAVVLADGTYARAGGMVVKNVAGYDMSRLYAGSFGTLAIIAQANFKTLPLPKQARLFLAPLPAGTRARVCAVLAALQPAPSAALCVQGFRNEVAGRDGDDGRVLVLLEGSEALLERASRELRSALGRAGVWQTQVADAGARAALQQAIDAYVATLGRRSITYRLAAPCAQAPARALAASEAAQRFELHAECILDAMNGDVLVRVSDANARAFGAKIEEFDERLHEREPAAFVVAGEHPHRAQLRVWGAEPAAIDRMRALKARFDLKRTLNPGRFVGGI